jgi:hypothetical protein
MWYDYESIFSSGSLDDVKQLFDDHDGEWSCNMDTAFELACGGGNLEVVQFLIEKGANNLRGGFDEACREGRIDIAKLMIDKGVRDWGIGIYNAGFKGQRIIVNLILEESGGKIGDSYYMQWLLIISVKYGWIDLILNTMYKVNMHCGWMGHKKRYKYRYDILGVYEKEWDKVEEKIINVKVKLFDHNLFL